MNIPAEVTEALTAALVDGADAATAIKLALSGYQLVRIDPASPALHFVPCLEEAITRTGGVDYHAAAKMLEAAFVIAPRVRFEKTDKGLIVLRGTEVVGDMYHWEDGDLWFLSINGHPQGDRPGIKGEMRARAVVQDILDQPA